MLITIGSRGSALAMAQAHWVRNRILAQGKDVRVVVKVIKTSADRDQTTSIRAGSGVGVFVKEIEEALLEHQVDVAVHSMKDVPTQIPAGLEIGAIPPREDAHDALICRTGTGGLDELPEGAVVGTGSVRRRAQLLARRPDLKVIDIRGNVDTRLQKLAEGTYDALVLACAGLQRLALESRITSRLGFEHMLPAPGQGALAVETRRNDPLAEPLLPALHHRPTAAAVLAERAFLHRMGGGCNVPVAAHASLEHGILKIEGLVASMDGTQIIRNAAFHAPQDAEQAAVALAEKILAAGGSAILKAL